VIEPDPETGAASIDPQAMNPMSVLRTAFHGRIPAPRRAPPRPTAFESAKDRSVEFDAPLCHRNIQSVRPGMRVMEVSAKSGAGLDAWIDVLDSTQKAKSPA
jgi:hypothetical protein